MPDHTFEIQLFLAGTAIAVLGVAVTQADWKHKIFVRGLFSTSFGLFIAAVFWPNIGPKIPQGIDVPLGAISSNAVSWLVLLALAVSAICALDYRTRLDWIRLVGPLKRGGFTQIERAVPQKRQPDSRQWFSSYKIFDLAEPSLMKAAVGLEESTELAEKHLEDIQRDRQLFGFRRNATDAINDLVNPSPEMVQWKAAEEEATRKFLTEQRQRDSARAGALEDIYQKLRNGKLVAKGFAPPVGSDSGELEIPVAYWRLIRFNGDYTQAKGQELQYVGITVARSL
jgi:hypothetical protein